MGVPKYTDEFKAGVVNQVTDKGHSVSSVARNLGISDVTLNAWIKKSGKTMGAVKQAQDMTELHKEVTRRKAENRRLQEERDILKKPRRTLRKSPAKERLHIGPSECLQGQANVPSPGGPSKVKTAWQGS